MVILPSGMKDLVRMPNKLAEKYPLPIVEKRASGLDGPGPATWRLSRAIWTQ
jgi:hypothetical protein